MGRTGSLWAYQQTPVRPDVMTAAKALGGGVPIGACITAPVAADVLQPGDHGSTFAGGPVATAAALAVLDIVDDPALLRRVRELGAELREGLEALDGVRETRGRGLMVGVGLEAGHRRRRARRRPARPRPRRQRPGARHRAAAAAAGGRFGSDRPGGWTDRRIASRLVRLVSPKRPMRRSSLEASTSERLAAIVAAAEQAASKVIDDAEAEGRRYLSEARAEADRLVAERLSSLAALTDSLVAQAEVIRQQSERLLAVPGPGPGRASGRSGPDRCRTVARLAPQRRRPGRGAGRGAAGAEPERRAPESGRRPPAGDADGGFRQQPRGNRRAPAKRL